MRGGGNRVPTALKELHGTARPDRANPKEPRLAAIRLPEPPPSLPKDEEAVWRRLVEAVDPMRVSTASDLEAFLLMVQSVALAHRVAKNRKSSVNQFAKAQTLAMSHLAKWGLTPADRARVVQLDSADLEDELAEFDAPAEATQARAEA